jgi:hypothetical protein
MAVEAEASFLLDTEAQWDTAEDDSSTSFWSERRERLDGEGAVSAFCQLILRRTSGPVWLQLAPATATRFGQSGGPAEVDTVAVTSPPFCRSATLQHMRARLERLSVSVILVRAVLTVSATNYWIICLV